VQNARVETSLAPQLPLVRIDAEQIKQVLLNLTINALQAMPEGGRVVLRTLLGNEKQVVSIEVEDEGEGVDPAIAARIFDPFFTTKEKGVGLGLSIAYKIAVQHGGSLTVRNGTRGAIFRLALPLAHNER